MKTPGQVADFDPIGRFGLETARGRQQELLRSIGAEREELQRHHLELERVRAAQHRRAGEAVRSLSSRVRRFIAYAGLLLPLACGSLEAAQPQTYDFPAAPTRAAAPYEAPVPLPEDYFSDPATRSVAGATATLNVPCFGPVPAAEAGDYYFFYDLTDDVDCTAVFGAFVLTHVP